MLIHGQDFSLNRWGLESGVLTEGLCFGSCVKDWVPIRLLSESGIFSANRRVSSTYFQEQTTKADKGVYGNDI